MTVNKVILVGNLGQDPEIRSTSGGTSVCNLRIATSEKRKGRDGGYTEHTEWHSVVVFGKQAEAAVRFLQKGRQVYIEGKLQTRKWQDRNGNDRYSTEIVADMYGGVKFLSGSKGSGSGGGGGGYNDGGYSGGSGGGYSKSDGGGSRPSPGDDIPPKNDDGYDDMPFLTLIGAGLGAALAAASVLSFLPGIV